MVGPVYFMSTSMPTMIQTNQNGERDEKIVRFKRDKRQRNLIEIDDITIAFDNNNSIVWKMFFSSALETISKY